MKRPMRVWTAGLMLLALLSWGMGPSAAEEITSSITIEPARFAIVDGNVSKFQTMHWMKDGYKGGIEEYTLKQVRDDGVTIEAEARAIIDEDYDVSIKMTREDGWYLNTEFSQWTRYYDVRGGSDALFPLTSGSGLDRELALDKGKFGMELGLLFETLPDVKIRYEHEYNIGAKSRLAWAATVEGAANRKIMPAYEMIDEDKDSVELELAHRVWGFDVTATQYWEFVRDRSELVTSDGQLFIREPDHSDTDLFSTKLKLERWFNQDTVFVGAAYKHNNLDNSVLAELYEYDVNGNRVNNGHASFDNTAYNKYDSHAVIANTFVRPFGRDDVAIVAKTLAEWVRKDGLSVNNHDDNAGVPNSIIDDSFWRDSEGQVDSFAQALSLRYTGIDRAALYGEVEFKQIDNFLDENAWGINGVAVAGFGNTYTRQTASNINRNAYTAGFSVYPVDGLDMTGQYRFKTVDNDNYNFNLSHPGTSPESAYIDSLFITTHEASAKVTYRPDRRVRPTVRYKFQRIDYDATARFQDQVGSTEDAQILAADLHVQPADNLQLTGTYQLQWSHIMSNAETTPAYNYAPQDVNYHTWMVVADWIVNDRVTLTGSVVNTIADDNFNDEQAQFQLRYGTEFSQVDASVGLEWKVKEGLVVEPKYAYYYYDGDHLDAGGDYEAHVLWLGVRVDWP